MVIDAAASLKQIGLHFDELGGPQLHLAAGSQFARTLQINAAQHGAISNGQHLARLIQQGHDIEEKLEKLQKQYVYLLKEKAERQRVDAPTREDDELFLQNYVRESGELEDQFSMIQEEIQIAQSLSTEKEASQTLSLLKEPRPGKESKHR